LNNVTTNYRNQYLQSRGMIAVDASDTNGELLFLAEGKSIEVNLPTGQALEEGFQIFEGKENDNGVTIGY